MLSRSRYALCCLFLFSMFLAFQNPALGQATTTGNLAGTVSDSSGAAVPNATLTIKNPLVGASVTQHSNSQGEFSFADLQVGTYTLTVGAQGFSTTVIQNVIIDTGRSRNLNPTLKVGATPDEVNITAAQEALKTTTNTLAATIRPDALQDLPLSGR